MPALLLSSVIHNRARGVVFGEGISPGAEERLSVHMRGALSASVRPLFSERNFLLLDRTTPRAFFDTVSPRERGAVNKSSRGS